MTPNSHSLSLSLSKSLSLYISDLGFDKERAFNLDREVEVLKFFGERERERERVGRCLTSRDWYY